MLRNQKVHYSVHKSQPPDSVLSQMKPVHPHTYIPQDNISATLTLTLHIFRPRCTHVSSTLCALRTHPILIYLITLVV
jgi:hypothetical protein